MNASKPKFPRLYLLLAYGLTWIFWIPVALTKQDYQTSPILLAGMFLGAFGPGAAGIIMTYSEQGKEGGRDFWRRVFDFRRISLKWYVLILLIYPALHLTAIAINHWLGGNPPEFAFVKKAMTMPVGILAIVILYLLQSALEELGWRGYMLDRLQALWNPVKASLVLGVFHALWHLPLFWIVGTNQNRYLSVTAFVLFIAFVTSGSFFNTWCYNDNRHSTLAVILLHTVANLALDTFLLPGTGEYIFKIVAAFGAVMIAIAWMFPFKETKIVRINLIGEYMQIRDFTLADYPALIAIHNSQNIVWPERPRTPGAWAEADRSRSPKSEFQRWIAVEDGQEVGFASYAQNSWNYPPQSFYINVEVLPDYQRRGVGSALYDRLMEGLQGFHPPALRADTFTNLPQGFAFLQKRGFYEAFRETPVHLDVASFDPRPYADLEPKLNTQGIFIKTLAELKSDPDRDRKIYELYFKVNADVPHEGEEIPTPGFDDWLGWGLSDPSIMQDAYLVAVHGDDYIGLRELGNYSDPQVLLGGLLGVRSDYRRRGIALAMQVSNITYGRDQGYRLIKDCTAIQNAPMQALFDQLGFTRDPEWQQCQKDFD